MNRRRETLLFVIAELRCVVAGGAGVVELSRSAGVFSRITGTPVTTE